MPVVDQAVARVVGKNLRALCILHARGNLGALQGLYEAFELVGTEPRVGKPRVGCGSGFGGPGGGSDGPGGGFF